MKVKDAIKSWNGPIFIRNKDETWIRYTFTGKECFSSLENLEVTDMTVMGKKLCLTVEEEQNLYWLSLESCEEIDEVYGTFKEVCKIAEKYAKERKEDIFVNLKEDIIYVAFF